MRRSIVCERIGHLAGNLMLTAILFVGTVLTAATPVNLSRQRAEETGKNITNGGHQSVPARNGINNCDDNNEKRVNDVDNNNAKSVATFPWRHPTAKGFAMCETVILRWGYDRSMNFSITLFFLYAEAKFLIIDFLRER